MSDAEKSETGDETMSGMNGMSGSETGALSGRMKLMNGACHLVGRCSGGERFGSCSFEKKKMESGW